MAISARRSTGCRGAAAWTPRTTPRAQPVDGARTRPPPMVRPGAREVVHHPAADGAEQVYREEADPPRQRNPSSAGSHEDQRPHVEQRCPREPQAAQACATQAEPGRDDVISRYRSPAATPCNRADRRVPGVPEHRQVVGDAGADPGDQEHRHVDGDQRQVTSRAADRAAAGRPRPGRCSARHIAFTHSTHCWPDRASRIAVGARRDARTGRRKRTSLSRPGCR